MAECTDETRQSTCKMRHEQLHNGWADDALKSRAMFLCFGEGLARAEESTSALTRRLTRSEPHVHLLREHVQLCQSLVILLARRLRLWVFDL